MQRMVQFCCIGALAAGAAAPAMAQGWQERQAWDWGQHRTSLVDPLVPVAVAEAGEGIMDFAPLACAAPMPGAGVKAGE